MDAKFISERCKHLLYVTDDLSEHIVEQIKIMLSSLSSFQRISSYSRGTIGVLPAGILAVLFVSFSIYFTDVERYELVSFIYKK